MRVFVAGGTGVIVHQMTAIAGAKPDMKHMDRWFATTNRLRTEGTDHLLAAAEATGVSHLVAQSYASWNGVRKGGRVKTEEDPLDLHTGTTAHAGMEAIRHVEHVVVKAGGAVPAIRRALRAGRHRRSGRARAQAAVPGRRGRHRLLLVGAFDDAASATVLAVEQKARGVFNIVDDEPAPASEWLPDPYEDPARSAELADSVSMAALLLLERAEPLEQAVFVLREVFGFGFPEVASACASRRRRAASSRCGRGATWAREALVRGGPQGAG